jgi:hypothetical protein
MSKTQDRRRALDGHIVRDERGEKQPADKDTAQRAGVVQPIDPNDRVTPEGLYRERKDPINPTTGRKPG